MMNSEPYSPFTMPIFGVAEEIQKKDQAWQLWEGNDQTFFNHAMINTQQSNLQFNPFPNCNPSPLPSLPAALPPPLLLSPQTEYYDHVGFLKLPVEERVGYGALNFGLNLSHSSCSYLPSAAPETAVSFNRLFWRSRGGYFFAQQPPRCQAEGCKADISNGKRYHRRHKVCELHSKASVVIISGGLQQRFCQQCSRFHSLDAFDDAKKSCRKRLADHNRRRRKPQPSDNGSDQAPSTAKKKPPASKSMNQASKSTKCAASTRKVSALNPKVLNRRLNNHNSQATCTPKNPSMSSDQDQFNYQEAMDVFSEDQSSELHHLQQQLSSSSSSNIQNMQHQNLPYSASTGVVGHCTGEIKTPDLIQIRQAMFELLDYV